MAFTASRRQNFSLQNLKSEYQIESGFKEFSTAHVWKLVSCFVLHKSLTHAECLIKFYDLASP